MCETVLVVKKCLSRMGFVESDLNIQMKCHVSTQGCNSHKFHNLDALTAAKDELTSHNEVNVCSSNEKDVSMEPNGRKRGISPSNLKIKRVNKRSVSPFALRGSERKSLHRKEKIKKSPNQKSGPFHNRRSFSSLDTKNRSTCKIFGGDLDNQFLFSAQLSDGNMAYIPEFVIDASKIILQNLTIEGIFRKAGSSQRQTEIKRLLNIGKDLPSSVHPIDTACLLKQYLNSLALPLIPTNIFSLMVRCLELTEESQLDALIFCTLLLERKRQDTLCFILELLAKVASCHEKNLMDTHNLSIVMAPNLLPQMLYKGKHLDRMSNVDLKLSSAILVVKILIEGAHKVCRVPSNIKQILSSQKITCSNSLDFPSNNELMKTAKKRRSGPINKFVNGLRRVVQGDLLSSSTSSSSHSSMDDLREASNYGFTTPSFTCKTNSKDTLILNNKENKKKCLTACDSDEHPNKRLRVENPSSEVIQIRHPLVPLQSKKSSSHFSLKESTSTPLKSYYDPCMSTHFKNSCPDIEIKPNEDHLKSRASMSTTPSNKLPYTSSSTPSSPHLMARIGKPRRRSSEPSRHFDPKDICHGVIYPQKRRSETFRKLTSPDGSVNKILGPRGIPDGAESTCRDSLSKKASTSDSLTDMEDHYCEVKFAVKQLEEQVDQSNLKRMNRSLFPNGDPCHLSFSEMISKAYESVKLETQNLDDLNPGTVSLSRRLDKELRIRGRRSSEYKVSRSPSERKIGIVRRRSKELKEKMPQPKTPSDFPLTPKLKSPLLRTPSNARLRPATPYSIKLEAGPLKPPQSQDRNNLNSSKANIRPSYLNTAPIPGLRSSNVRQRPPPLFNASEIWDSKLDSPLRLPADKTEGSMHWTPAHKFMKKLDEQSSSNLFQPDIGMYGHRSSIAALRRQKVVSSNVQLFNKN